MTSGQQKIPEHTQGEQCRCEAAVLRLFVNIFFKKKKEANSILLSSACGHGSWSFSMLCLLVHKF
jgi:hypothetical protein